MSPNGTYEVEVELANPYIGLLCDITIPNIRLRYDRPNEEDDMMDDWLRSVC